MSDFLLLVGFFWALTAPFLTTGVLWLAGIVLWRLLPASRRPLKHMLALGVACAGWAILLTVHFFEVRAFTAAVQKIPTQEAPANLPITDTIYLDSQTANSFGSRYVYQGFKVQMKQYPTTQTLQEVSLDDKGQYQNTPISTITARATVREVFEEDAGGFSYNRTEIWVDDVRLAHAFIANYKPSGIQKWALAGWGYSDWPKNGDMQWSRTYHLACMTLLKKSLDACMKARPTAPMPASP